MLHIKCPNCGLRNESEFACGGEAHIIRPEYEVTLSDKEWAEYLFMRYNPKGNFTERWVHTSGCRRWFNVLRNTVTNEITEVYPSDQLPSSRAGKEYYKNNWRRESASERLTTRQVEK